MRARARLEQLLAEGRDELAFRELERRSRLLTAVDRRSDGCDLRRGRPATAADEAGAEVARMRGELGEVLGRRVRVDDATTREAGEPDVGQGRQRQIAVPHLLERGESREETASVVGSDRRDVESAQPVGGLARGHARERLRRLVEGHQRNDREPRDGANGLDRVLDLVQVVEGLDREEVCSAAFEDPRLLREELAADARGRGLPERADRAPR